jgi:hypothetical protein
VSWLWRGVFRWEIPVETWRGNIVINETSKSDHIYFVGGNACNAFCLGNIGIEDDFFLVGAEADAETNYPMLTGNFFSSEGEFLFRLVRNVLTINPGQCSKIIGDHIGYQIRDSAGEEILTVRTTWTGMDGPSPKLVTTLAGKFYDRSRKLVVHAKSGKESGVDLDTKMILGWPTGFWTFKPTEVERMMLSIALATGGAVLRPMTGRIADMTIKLDGKFLWNVEITNCDIHVHSGNWRMEGKCHIHHNRIVYFDDARRIVELYSANVSAEGGSREAQSNG